MKAVAVFPGEKKIQLVDVGSPATLSPSQVRLRMLEVGICGTDKEIAEFQYGTPPDGSNRLIIGHESLAEVSEIGSAVSKVNRGDLVVSMVRRPCNHPECIPCRSGRQDFCVTGDYVERGIKQIDGFMSESVVDEEKYLFKVPQPLKDVAVLVEPLTIAEKALMQVDEVQDRLPGEIQHMPANPSRAHKALVLGAGPVGLLGAMALATRGYRTHVYSRESATGRKARITKQIGATYFSSENYKLPDVAEEIGNIDLVYEATGASQLAFAALAYLGVNAIFVFTGVPGRKGPIQVDTDLIMRNLVLKNQIILGTVNAGANAYESAIQSVGLFKKAWPQAIGSVITGRYPITAFADLLSGKIQGIKNVIAFDHAGVS